MSNFTPTEIQSWLSMLIAAIDVDGERTLTTGDIPLLQRAAHFAALAEDVVQEEIV
jgi:hypothetical protein